MKYIFIILCSFYTYYTGLRRRLDNEKKSIETNDSNDLRLESILYGRDYSFFLKLFYYCMYYDNKNYIRIVFKSNVVNMLS